jgi:hypothetical protein
MKGKKLVPTEFGKLVYKFNIDPVTANNIVIHLQNSGDIDCTISAYKQFLDMIRIWGIKRGQFNEASYDITTEDYRNIQKFDVEKENCGINIHMKPTEIGEVMAKFIKEICEKCTNHGNCLQETALDTILSGMLNVIDLCNNKVDIK